MGLIADLELTYQMLIYGYKEPTKLLMDPKLAMELTRITISHYTKTEWPFWLTKKDAAFNSARVVPCPLMVETWAFVPSDDRLVIRD